MAAIPTPRSSLRGRLAEALGCRSAALRSPRSRGLLLQRQSQRSCHAPHRSSMAAEFGGYLRFAKSLPGEPDHSSDLLLGPLLWLRCFHDAALDPHQLTSERKLA